MKPDKRCSFCDKPKSEVKLLLGRGYGNGDDIPPYICNECVDAGNKVLGITPKKELERAK